MIVKTKYLRRWFIEREINKFKATGHTLEIGSGKKLRYVKDSITLSRDPSTEPDIIQDAEEMSFENEFDCIILLEVLEHTKRPADVVTYVSKALKRSGRVLITMPFCFETHSQEVEYLLKDYADINITPHGGMVSVMMHYIRITSIGRLFWPVFNYIGYWVDNVYYKVTGRMLKVTLGYGVTAVKP